MVTRPKLREIPLEAALPLRPGVVTVTMRAGQWDALLAEFYAAGAVLLLVDEHDRPTRAFQSARGIES
jgi:hypothetical protein